MQPLPAPRRNTSSNRTAARDHQNTEDTQPEQPDTTSNQPNMEAQGPANTAQQSDAKKKRRHRGGKRKKNRRQSFAAPSEGTDNHSVTDGMTDDPLVDIPEDQRAPFYRMRSNISDESLNSEALLDHRDQPAMRPRANSRLLPGMFNQMQQRSPAQSNTHIPSPIQRRDSGRKRRQSRQAHVSSDDDEEDHREATDKTPLLSGAAMNKSPTNGGYGLQRTRSHTSTIASDSKVTRRRGNTAANSFPKYGGDYDVNNPPSVPTSPNLAAHPEDVMVANGGDFLTSSPDSRRNLSAGNRDALIDIDGDDARPNSAPPSPRLNPGGGLQRSRTLQFHAEGDVCFPGDEMSEIVEEELGRTKSSVSKGSRRRRRAEWPQLWALDDWSREEKEIRAGERRAKKVNEPVLVEGRLRPSKHYWHRTEEDAPYRYTYFCEEFESTIHAQTISELVQPGGNFRELFIPDPPELSDSSDSDEDAADSIEMNGKNDDDANLLSPRSQQPGSANVSRVHSMLGDVKPDSGQASGKSSGGTSGRATPQPYVGKAAKPQKPKKYGARPTFWLDVLCPTDQEMRVLCKAFGIHALTSEDIMLQEAREKVELFRNYYFINYRTFEQDSNSEDYLEPVNMYVCVFQFGIITFHFSQVPHPANVRRRIRQLTDYLILSADWISYAIIDDITDVYHPLVTSIEEEVDDIDDMILNALQTTNELSGNQNTAVTSTNKSEAGEEPAMTGMDMLRRIGECRKKVMSLYRLLGQKADVIKGFAKRCNEQWEVAPKSEIGLYLGDIQDHIITMSSNLSHYETLLSRAHSNYLAQVNIKMGERQENTADILGKLTVIGTIVLPMNIICGMWGMNVKVPGQEIDNLYWFWAITTGLLIFAVVCFMWCKKVYKIV